MKASDWKYAGEGGKHALFSFDSGSEGDPKFVGQLLRLDKRFLRQSVHSTDTVEVEDVHVFSQPEQAETRAHAFLCDIMKPHFAHHLDLPSQVLLPWPFVHRIRANVLETQPSPIPEARRKDWRADNIQKPTQPVATGWLLRDYRSAAQLIQPSLVMSFEIKPKAGYLASSPLVDPRHAAKFYDSRFVLLQKLDSMGYQDEVKRGWQSTNAAGIPRATSSYDPLDLFSKDPSRTKRALEALWGCPQNNFKVWITPYQSNESLLLVADKHYLTESIRAQTAHLLKEIYKTKLSSDYHGLPKEFLISLLDAILHAEGHFLEKLRQWQRMDVLDADGAIVIYNRLLDLCKGSQKEAQQTLDQYCTPKREDLEPRTFLGIPGTPLAGYAEASSCPTFQVLMEELQHFSGSLQRVQQSHDDQRGAIDRFLRLNHDLSRHMCLRQIDQLQSTEACCYLLQNWLLSLVVCDVSFFVTIQQAPKDEKLVNAMEEDWSALDTSYTTRMNVVRQQSDDPGMMEIHIIEEGKTRILFYSYEIKLIDCDPKPAKKLQSRHRKEKVFQYL